MAESCSTSPHETLKEYIARGEDLIARCQRTDIQGTSKLARKIQAEVKFLRRVIDVLQHAFISYVVREFVYHVYSVCEVQNVQACNIRYYDMPYGLLVCMIKDHVNIVVRAASLGLLASFFSIEEPGSPRHSTNKQSAKISYSIALIKEGLSDI